MHGAPSPGLWLKFLGTGHAVSFIFKSNNHNDNDPGRIYVYKGKCGELNLEDFGNFNNNQFRISKVALVQQTLEKIYKDSLIYLPRKFNIYLLSCGSCSL